MAIFTRGRLILGTMGALAVGAAGVGVLYSTGGSPQSTRPLLARVNQTSSYYLTRHAQPWLACPAAANKCYRWKVQEAAGNLTDDMSGDAAVLTANGTPVYQTHTSIPDTTGFSGRRAIWSASGDASYFTAADNATGDVTTNDFSVKFWLYWSGVVGAGANGYIIEKYQSATRGWAIYINASKLTIIIYDATGLATGFVSNALPVNTWNYYVVNFDRDGNASALIDGVSTGATVNIAGRPGSLSLAQPIVLYRHPAAATFDLKNSALSELLIANGLTTTVEALVEYKAFKVPTATSVPGIVSTLTYTQSTTRKFQLPTEAGFGERLGMFAGSATNPQWPVGYEATRVNATRGNSLGLVFPTSPATVNTIGYAREFNSWSAGAGTVITANSLEGPDGSVLADTATYAAGTGYNYKVVVGGGNVLAGERWCGSLRAKSIGGAGILCLASSVGGGSYNTGNARTLTADWKTYYTCNPAAAVGDQKGIIIWCASAAADCTAIASSKACVIGLDESQYEANNVTSPCTSTTGNVSQTCNASYYSMTSTKFSTMPQSLERVEVVYGGSSVPMVSAPGATQTKWVWGNQSASLAEGVNTALSIKDQAGGVEYTAKYRGTAYATESRDYTSSWNMRDGLTNTNPRRYGGLSVARSGSSSTYTSFVQESRNVNAAIDAVTPQQQKDLNSSTIYVGCDASTGTPTNCSLGGVDTFEVWGRPAQDVKVADSTQVLLGDFSGAGFMQAQGSYARLNLPTGAVAATSEIFDFGEYSGSLYGRLNGTVLTPTGTPRYAGWSGLLARGQGRRGIRFNGTTDYIQAPDAVGNAIGNNAAYTWAAIVTTTGVAWKTIISTQAAPDLLGYSMMTNGTGVDCTTRLSAANTTTRSSGALAVGKHLVQCTGSIVAGAFVPHVYVDGVLNDGALAVVGAVTLPIANGGAFTLGRYYAGGPLYFDGQVHEVYTRPVLMDAATALAEYKQLTQQGTFLTNAANTSHYKLNETTLTNGVGVKDHTANGNHLTVVAGTPTPQYADMPWPAGSGTYKPAIEYNAAGNYHSGGAATGVPANAQPFSLCTWMRIYAIPAAAQQIITKGTANDYYDLYVLNASGFPRFRFNTNEGGLASTTTATNIADNNWHLICAKVTYTGGATYTPYISIDGGAFTYVAGSTTTGDPSGNAANIVLGQGLAATPVQLSDAMFIPNYELTDANVAAMVPPNAGSPLASLTYTRTDKACYETGNHPVDGIQVRCWNANQVPFAYESSLGSSMGNERFQWGIPSHDAVINKINKASEVMAAPDILVGLTAASNVVSAPDGATTAEKFTETAVDETHRWITSGLAPSWALNEYRTASVYLRKGAGTTWVTVSTYDGTSIFGGYVNVNLDTAAAGLTGSGDPVNTPYITSSVLGVGGGWIKVSVTSQCLRVAGCSQYLAWYTRDGNNVWNATSHHLGALTNYVYASGVQLRAEYPALNVYCPTTVAGSTTTCNASNLSVAAANLASWTRGQGQITWLGYSRNPTGVAWDLANGVNNNGRHYLLSQGSETYIYDNAGVLQNRWSLANAQINTVTGIVQSFDSTGVYYTDPAGIAQTAYGRTMQTGYNGPWPTYTTRSNGWVPGVGTDLYLGSDSASSNRINGVIVNVSIHSAK
jgi:hypothetical protein